MKLLNLSLILFVIFSAACNRKNSSPYALPDALTAEAKPSSNGSGTKAANVNYDLVQNLNNIISIKEELKPNDYLSKIVGTWKLVDAQCSLCGPAYGQSPDLNNEILTISENNLFEIKINNSVQRKGGFSLTYENCGPESKVLLYKENNNNSPVGSFIHLNAKDTLSFVACANDGGYRRYEKIKK